MDSLPCWQKIWKSFTSNFDIHEKVVDILPFVEKELPLGIAAYEPFAVVSFEAWKKKCGSKSEVHSSLSRLIRELSISLNLNSCTVWGVFCNFLMFNYYGKFKDIANLAKYEIHGSDLIKELYKFYSSERMFKLKTLKYILEHYEDEGHRYKKELNHFVKTITFKKLRANLMEQFKILLNEIDSDSAETCFNIQDWIHRNNREQLEVLLCIGLTLKYEDFEMPEFIALLRLFKAHDFTRQPLFYQGRSCARASDYVEIKDVEFGLFFIGMKPFWTDKSLWEQYSTVIRDLLVKGFEEYYRHENVLFAMYYSALNLYYVDTGKEKEEFYKLFKEAVFKNALEVCVQVARGKVLKGSRINMLVRESIFTLLDSICYIFREDDEGILYDSKASVELLAELLKDEDLAIRCLNGVENRIKSFYLLTANMFPFDFDSITLLARALISHKQFANDVMDSLIHIPHYLDLCTESANDGFQILEEPFFPISHAKNFIIPQGTMTHVFCKYRKVFIRFHHEYSYFNIFAIEVERIVKNKMKDKAIVDLEISRIKNGYLLILEILRNFSASEISRFGIQFCLKLMEFIFELFVQEQYFDLIKICFEIAAEMIKGDKIFDVNREYTILNIFPVLIIRDIHVATEFNESFLSPAYLLEYLKKEEVSDDHSMVIKYITLVKDLFEKKKLYEHIVLPGVLYIVLHVFPEHIFWKYKTINDKFDVTKECLSLLFLIMERNLNISETLDRTVFRFCLDSIFEKKQVLNAFLSNFDMNNDVIQMHMESESNWNNGPTMVLLHTKKLTFTLMLLLIKYNDLEKESGKQTFFDKLLMQVNHDSLKVIHSIISFVNNNFWLALPNLACAQLKCFAALKFAFLPSLNLDYCQVQSIFLEKLHDPLVHNSLKISILEFVNVCIIHQDGMLAAFFNINCDSISVKQEIMETCESIKAIMLNYLDNQKESSNYLQHPVQLQILVIFNNLWKYEKELIIADIIKTENFWEILLKPLFQELKLCHEAYSLLLGIISLEIYRSREHGIDKSLLNRLKVFFDAKEKHYVTWGNYFTEMCKKPIKFEKPDNFNKIVNRFDITLMFSWKHFLIMTIKNVPECFEDVNVKVFLANSCLDSLSHHVFVVEDIRVIRIFSDIYLFLVSNWSVPGNIQTVNKIINVLNCFVNCYKAFSMEACNTLLAIVSATIKDYKVLLKVNPNYLDGFLIPLGKICECGFSDISLDAIDDQPDEKYKINPPLKHWVLILSVGNNLLQIGDIVQHGLWFSTFNFLPKVLTSTVLFLQKPKTLLVAKISIDTLILYAKSHLNKDFLNVDLGTFYEGTRPPNLYLNYAVLKREYRVPRYLKEWWATYGELIKFNITLMERFGDIIASTCLTFIYVHDEILRVILLSLNHTVDHNALNLICLVLKFIETMLHYKFEWISNNKVCFERIIVAIIETLNASIMIILRPSILFFIDKDLERLIDKKVSASKYVIVMNKIMEIVALCFRSFSACLPSINEFMEVHKFKELQYMSVVYDFQVPKYTLFGRSTDTLTYGSLLCLLYFLSKTSMQISVINKLDQNRAETTNVGGDKNLTTLIGLKDDSYHALILPETVEQFFPEKMNTVLKFAISEVQGSSHKWLTQLNSSKVKFALEMLLRFLSVQVYLVTNSSNIAKSDADNFKKEMSSELHYFNEFAKKCIYEKYQGKGLPMKRKREFVHFLELIDGKSKGSGDNDDDFHEEYMLFVSYWLMDFCKINL